MRVENLIDKSTVFRFDRKEKETLRVEICTKKNKLLTNNIEINTTNKLNIVKLKKD